MTKFAKVLKAKREERGLTQKELATAIGLTSSQYISNCERGVCPMSPMLVKKCAQVLRVRKEVLISAALEDYAARYREVMG